MPQVTDAVSLSKRPYRKGSPLTVTERQQALIARRKETHKEIKVYVSSELKSLFQSMCETQGITQAEMIGRLIKNASGSQN
ncbi:replication regulatory protein RepA [Xenorhabdus sp. XENO-1]|uniref:replication regulatory protein RepA n=1 Tax=Xenorhabdus bovienii TaxID=40576 RepID=UPI0020CA886B|nr:replication regulatory protein RepA [Xenorhabdus bovienii subsp. africana]